MTQRNRIVLATIALVAALCLAAPSPSRAAGLRPWNIPVAGAWERAWSWMAGLLPGGVSPKPARQGKEGGMIDPNGHTGLTAPAPATTTTTDKGVH